MKTLFLFVIVSLSPSLFAQGNLSDVCCILAKVSGKGAETQAVGRSPAECKGGQKEDEFRVCGGVPDPDNLCPTLTPEKQCKTCGYFWDGKVCMTEDPMKKAREIAKEELKKAEDATKKK